MANDINDTNQNNDEDNFGLPDIEYKPLEQLEQKTESTQEFQPEPEVEQSNESYSGDSYNKPKYSDATHSYEADEKSNAPMVIGLIIGLVILVGAVLVWKFVYQPRKDKEKQEQLLAEKKKKEAAEKAARAREEEERKRKEAEAAANVKPAIGAIETLSARTGRYYVIVSSAVDGDLVMDNAKKLSAKGVSTKIIPPFGKWKFYRLTIGDYDSFASAQSSADAAKAEYGPSAWVMKY